MTTSCSRKVYANTSSPIVTIPQKTSTVTIKMVPVVNQNSGYWNYIDVEIILVSHIVSVSR